MTLTGKVALVTGSGRGIGAATARLLAARGASVVVNYLNSAQVAADLVAEIKAAGGRALAIQADVRDAQQVTRLVAETKAAFARIDILVINAATYTGFKFFPEMTWEDLSIRVDAELRAAFLVTQAVLPGMIDQHYGRLVYLGSEHAKGPIFPLIAHGTAKAALAAFVTYLAYEMGPLGITANIVSPGTVETEANVARIPAFVRQKIVAATPLGRLALPEDIARVIAFFADDDSGFMTGVCAPVSGGFGLAQGNILAPSETSSSPVAPC